MEMKTTYFNIVFESEKFTFKKLLGISLLERNFFLAKILNYNKINIICKNNDIKKISQFIKFRFINKKFKDIEIKYNLKKDKLNFIYSNDLFNYKFKEVPSTINQLNKLKIIKIKNENNFTKAKDELYIKIDKPPAEKIFFFTNSINRPIGKHLTNILVNTSITPNFITLIVLLTGLMATCFLFSNQYHHILLSILFFQLSSSLDCVDGPIARLKYQTSYLGSILDSYNDKIIKFLFYFGIGLNSYVLYGNILSIYLSILLIIINILVHVIEIFFIRKKRHHNKSFKIDKTIRLKNILNSDLNIIGIGCIFLFFKIPHFYLYLLILYFSLLLMKFLRKVFKIYL